MNNLFLLVCPCCKTERQVTRHNHSYHTKKGGTGKCKKCYLKERNDSDLNKRKFIDGKPIKQHPYYQVWRNMMRRCFDKKIDGYKDYGARGITVCKDWCDSKKFLLWVDGKKDKQPGYELDRINNDGNYEPKNCRFVPTVENSQNRRSTKLNKDAVLLIRQLSNQNQLNIKKTAAKFNVAESTIQAVIEFRTWRNISAPSLTRELKEVC